ncbi:hypothetical protein [Actinoplanes sp. URMC 104]|uniref:hypothetical protein n=1 Tax=Actinoplanes sp. URMC 104 TaxID=3423409 RepID=UPI003F1C1847
MASFGDGSYTGPTEFSDRRQTVYRSPRVKVDFQMNRAGIRDIATGSDLTHALQMLVLTKALPYALKISPKGRKRSPSERDEHSRYASSFTVRRSTVVLVGMERTSVRLVNTAKHAAAVEWVNPNGHGHGFHVLGQTIAHLNGETLAGLRRRQARKRDNRRRRDQGQPPLTPKPRNRPGETPPQQDT